MWLVVGEGPGGGEVLPIPPDSPLTQNELDDMPNIQLCGVYDQCDEKVPYVWNISHTGG